MSFLCCAGDRSDAADTERRRRSSLGTVHLTCSSLCLVAIISTLFFYVVLLPWSPGLPRLFVLQYLGPLLNAAPIVLQEQEIPADLLQRDDVVKVGGVLSATSSLVLFVPLRS